MHWRCALRQKPWSDTAASATHAAPTEVTTLERPGHAREQCETEMFSRYFRSTPCLITLDVTGDQGKARRSCGTTLVVRVDGPVRHHSLLYLRADFRARNLFSPSQHTQTPKAYENGNHITALCPHALLVAMPGMLQKTNKIPHPTARPTTPARTILAPMCILNDV